MEVIETKNELEAVGLTFRHGQGFNRRDEIEQVERILLSPSYRTSEIIVRFLEEALPCATDKMKSLYPLRAQKLLWIMAEGEKRALRKKKENQAIPKDSLMLVALSELVPEETVMTLTEITERYPLDEVTVRRERKKSRSYKNCLGCDRRFLAKRANNLTCSPKCRQRVARTPSLSQISVLAPPDPA